MRNVVIALLVLLPAAVGCEGSSGSDGGIILPDGAGSEADGGSDAGADAGTDGGGYCGSTSMASSVFGRLPASCLPRCSVETRDAVAACTTVECQYDAMSMDTTPAVTLDTRYGDYVVSCGGGSDGSWPCVLLQTFSCDADECTDQYLDVSACGDAPPGCPDEWAALNECRALAPWQACAAERTPECFAQM